MDDKDLEEPLIKKDAAGQKQPEPWHIFHWSEFAFSFLLLAGGALFITTQLLVVPYAVFICGGLSGLISLLGLSTTWNLATVKRIAAATEKLKGDVQRLEAENNRATDMLEKTKKQDVKMKKQLENMQQASMILKAASTDLESIQEQEKELIAQRLELMERRRVLSEKMNKDMERCLDLSLEATKEEFAERFMMYFRKFADSQGVVHADQWALLKQLAIVFSQIDLGDQCLSAGGVEQCDFVNHVDAKLEAYFTKLKADAIHVQAIKMEMWAKEIECIE